MNGISQTDKELKKLQDELTNLALKIADTAKVELDFSIGSIKKVEEILSQVHGEYMGNKHLEGMNGVALELAAYIITVIEKNVLLGKWMRNSKEFGPDTFPYELKDGDVIFPYNWCLKRIVDGDSENVWLKFQALVLKK